MDDFKPKLDPKEDRPSREFPGLPWKTAQESLNSSDWNLGKEQLAAKIKKKLIDRWSEHALVRSILALIENQRKILATLDELLESVLHRLDRNLPLSTKKKGANGQSES